jgi:hypothetical protein
MCIAVHTVSLTTHRPPQVSRALHRVSSLGVVVLRGLLNGESEISVRGLDMSATVRPMASAWMQPTNRGKGLFERGLILGSRFHLNPLPPVVRPSDRGIL